MHNPGEFLRKTENAEGILRALGCAERAISPTASDYEFFRALCGVKDGLAGNRLLLAAESLLAANGFEEKLSAETCDKIWRAFAERLLPLRSPDLLRLAPVEEIAPKKEWNGPAFVPLAEILISAKDAGTPEAFEKALLAAARERGVSVALQDAAFTKQPDPFSVSRVLASGEGGDLLSLQALRVCAAAGTPLLIFLDGTGEVTLSFLRTLERLVGLPRLFLAPMGEPTKPLLDFLFAVHGKKVSLVLPSSGVSPSFSYEYPCGAAYSLDPFCK